MSRIAFSLVGGAHQFLHGLPVAAALSRRAGVEVEAFVARRCDARAARELLVQLDGPAVQVREMSLPGWLEALAARGGAQSPLKVLRLARWAATLRGFDGIVALERTSAFLKQLPGRCLPLVQIPHGVGGARRAGGGGVDRRLALFDRALVSGEADRASTVALGLLEDAQIDVVGQVKLAGLRRLGRLERHRLFANQRPTVLYNPHFHARRGTWKTYGRALIEALRRDGRFNLVVAPHVRLCEGMGEAERAQLRGLSDPDWLLVDPGSQASMDMTYTLGADIYLGDFSSQLYEWLIYQRPCVFIDQVGDGGRDDTKLPEMWSTGEVVHRIEDVLPALERASARHGEFAPHQAEIVHHAVGDPNLPSDEIAAARILAMLESAREEA